METKNVERSGTGAVLWSGLIAGAVFMMLEMIMVPLFGDGSAWGPPRMIAAIVLGEGVLPPPATFDFGIIMTAVGVHFALSIVYTYVLSLFIRNSGTATALTIGAVFGLALYFINFYGFTGLFPWFADARNWISIVSHIAFGIVAAWSFTGMYGTEPEVKVTRKEEEAVEV